MSKIVFKQKISEEIRAFILFASNCVGWKVNVNVKETGISGASLYRILKKRSVNGNCHGPEHQFQRQKRGRPAKLSSRDKRLLLREIPCLRKEEGQFTVKRLMFQAGITRKQVSYRAVQHCML